MTSRREPIRRGNNKRSVTERTTEGNDKPGPAAHLGKIRTTKAALSAIDAFVSHVNKLGIDGLRREFLEVQHYEPPNATYQKFNENPERNRYPDIKCLDASRVVLTLNVPPETDYIHANWVRMADVDRTFIVTQGPKDNTIADFWRMAFQENVSTIIMLCQGEEGGRQKCAQYWPREKGTTTTYGGISVTNKTTAQEDRFITFTLEILPEGCSNASYAKLFQMVDWPDRGVPQSGMCVLRLIKMVQAATKVQGNGPCVIHCSAGIGRSGSIIAVEAAIQRLWKGQNINVKEIVQQLRNCRVGMVQTEAQYVFVHASVLYYIQAKLPKHRDAAMTFYSMFMNAQLV
ncbi:protein-tyrosine phosphatase [Aphelenchoides avenae]|nr:protein-tyrosine phosphatase [Aphelenchus avenae]